MTHYDGEQAALASTAAARLNGYVGGAGSGRQLAADLERLGLTAETQSYLRKSVRR